METGGVGIDARRASKAWRGADMQAAEERMEREEQTGEGSALGWGCGAALQSPTWPEV